MSCISRRHLILGSLVLGATRPLGLLSVLSGCGSGEETIDPILRVPLAEIPEEGRLEKVHGRVAVELRRVDGEIRGRSLLCSHQFCRVEWKPEEQHYLCPCDGGLFAADGSVLYGRQEKPLRELEFDVVGDEVWIDTHQIYRASPPAP